MGLLGKNGQRKNFLGYIDWRVVLKVAAILLLIDLLFIAGATALFPSGGGIIFIRIYLPLKSKLAPRFLLALLASFFSVIGLPFLGGFYAGWKAAFQGGVHGFCALIIERSVLSLIIYGSALLFTWQTSRLPPFFPPGLSSAGKFQMMIGQIFGFCLMAVMVAGLPGYIGGKLGERLQRTREKKGCTIGNRF